jgi:hypothetical protein
LNRSRNQRAVTGFISLNIVPAKANKKKIWRPVVRVSMVVFGKKKDIHIRKPSKPIKEVQKIYKATGCKDAQKAVKKM